MIGSCWRCQAYNHNIRLLDGINLVFIRDCKDVLTLPKIKLLTNYPVVVASSDMGRREVGSGLDYNLPPFSFSSPSLSPPFHDHESRHRKNHATHFEISKQASKGAHI